MRIGIKRSVAKAICKRWGFPLVLKSVKTRRQRFLEIKAALLKHCKQKLAEAQREEAALRKAIIGWERLEKAGAGRKREKADNGTIRTWGDGKKYRRVAPGKWLRVYQGNEEAESKGGVRAWKNIIKKLNAIDDERELMWFVQQNKMRFIDNRGYPLNVVEQLSELAELRNLNIIAKKSPEKIKELEDEAIEREGYEKQVADMKAKVNKYVNEEHSLEELRGLQAEAQALHDDIKAMNGSLNNRGSRLSALMRRAVIPLRQVEAAVLDAEEEHERQEAAAKEAAEKEAAEKEAAAKQSESAGAGRRDLKPDQVAKHEDDIKKLATAFFRYTTDKYNDDNVRILDNFCSKVELNELLLYGNKISKDNPLEFAPGVFLVGYQFTDIVTNDKGKKQIEAYKQKQERGRESAKKLNEQMSKEKDAAIQEKEERQQKQEAKLKASAQDIARRRELAIANGAEELIKEFSHRGSLTLDDVKTLFDYENTDVAAAQLFDAVYEQLKDMPPTIRIEQLKETVGGDALLFEWRVRFNSNLYERNLSANARSRVFTHELIHLVTLDALRAYDHGERDRLTEQQRQACETLNDVFSKIRNDKDFKGEYGLTNVYEMVAELSNVDFRQKLKRKNLWVRIVDSIAKIVRVFKKGCKAASALETAEGALYRLIDSFGREDEETKDGQHSEAFPLELKEKPPIQKQLGKVDDWLVTEAAKNASEISKKISKNRPRLMVRKSVARRALRSPLPRLAFTKSGRLVVRR